MARTLDRSKPRQCVDCGNHFVMRSPIGRPRMRCYDCLPDRVEQELPPGVIKCSYCRVPFAQHDNETLCSERCVWLADAAARWRAEVAKYGADEVMRRVGAKNRAARDKKIRDEQLRSASNDN
jgi:hypothetical protein